MQFLVVVSRAGHYYIGAETPKEGEHSQSNADGAYVWLVVRFIDCVEHCQEGEALVQGL
jgi:hypothetical protein